MNVHRSLHVISGLSEHFGGPSYSVPRLCETLRAIGADTAILSVQDETSGAPTSRSEDLRFPQDFAKNPLLRHLRISRALQRALDDEARRADTIHDHGLWLAPNLYAGWSARNYNKPFVVSPRGMLSEEALRFSSVKKRLFWNILQGPAFGHVACYHATSTGEYSDIRRFGIRTPVAIVPNGIDLPPLPEPSPPTEWRTVLYLGRIHPKKGIDRLLKAWAVASKPSWRLRIVGVDEHGHASELKALALRLDLRDVSFEDPLYGAKRLDAYREADLFVLPTFNENFGLTIAEALAAETPAITTKGAPWQGLETNACGWWIDHGAEPLAAALTRAMALPQSTLKEMGANGRAWMERDFSWDRVAHEMLDVYHWLARGTARPDTVRVD